MAVRRRRGDELEVLGKDVAPQIVYGGRYRGKRCLLVHRVNGGREYDVRREDDYLAPLDRISAALLFPPVPSV